MSDRNQTGNSNDTARLIREKMRQICRRSGIPRGDRQVVVHDLGTHLVLQLVRFDPDRAQLNTYIDRIAERWFVSYLRHRFAEKRDPRREECSLNDPVLDVDGRPVERHEVIVADSDVSQRLHELEYDMAGVLGRLSDLHRAVARAILAGFESTNSLAIEFGVSRPVIDRIKAELRQAFEDGGLREYLD